MILGHWALVVAHTLPGSSKQRATAAIPSSISGDQSSLTSCCTAYVITHIHNVPEKIWFPHGPQHVDKDSFSPIETSTRCWKILPHSVSRLQWHFEDPSASSWAVLKKKISWYIFLFFLIKKVKVNLFSRGFNLQNHLNLQIFLSGTGTKDIKLVDLFHFNRGEYLTMHSPYED